MKESLFPPAFSAAEIEPAEPVLIFIDHRETVPVRIIGWLPKNGAPALLNPDDSPRC
jgi:hypothetical protein